MEEWRKIKNYPNYSISSLGRVRTDVTGKIRKCTISNKGYKRVGLQPSIYPNHPQPDIKNLARLVAEAFIRNPLSKPEVNHKDGIKANNRADNLEWATSSENQLHAYKTGLQVHVHGVGHFAAKLKDSDIRKIRTMWKSGNYYQYEIAKKFGIIQQNVSLICQGKTWAHV